jgi:esterase/lipase
MNLLGGVTRSLKRLLIALIYAGVGVFLAALTAFVLYFNDKPDLEAWHTIELEGEFKAATSIESLDEYLDLENNLFMEMHQRINDALPADKKSGINRFTRGSLSDPERWPQNWNRTYQLKTDNPTAGVLLLHGLSDSPISLRHVGQGLHDAGAWVVGLRIPGHGTAPSGLVNVTWQDMAAAVRLAMLHLHDTLGDKPLYIVGYSNGAALAVHYTLTALDQKDLPMPERLVMISPAISVSPIAAFAVWQSRIGHWLGLEKLEWVDVLPEYDPYKYQSFAVNAGDLVFRLTAEVQRLLVQVKKRSALEHFPPTLAFISAVDATVSTRAVKDFFVQLPPNQHQLVVFDLNRFEGMGHLLKNDPGPMIDGFLNDQSLSFAFSVVRNRNPSDPEVMISTNQVASPTRLEQPLNLTWPNHVYSLSHLALPFPAHDPLYGSLDALPSPGIALGDIALRGERGVLQIGASEMLRQRWNPFYSLIEDQTKRFLLQSAPAGDAQND